MMERLSEYVDYMKDVFSEDDYDYYDLVVNALKAFREDNKGELLKNLELLEYELRKDYFHKTDDAVFETMLSVFMLIGSPTNHPLRETWCEKVVKQRENIGFYMLSAPQFINKEYLEGIFEKNLASAYKVSNAFLDNKLQIQTLTWDEVFEKDYSLPQNQTVYA